MLFCFYLFLWLMLFINAHVNIHVMVNVISFFTLFSWLILFIGVHVIFVNIIMSVIILLVFFIINVWVICYVNIGIMVSFYIFLLFTNMFCLLNSQKIAKKVSPIQAQFVDLFRISVWKSPYSCVFFFTPMCRLASMFNYV